MNVKKSVYFALVALVIIIFLSTAFSFIKIGEPSYASSEPFRSTDNFNLYKPVGKEAQTYFNVDENDIEKSAFFRLKPANGKVFESVKYSDGDTWTDVERDFLTASKVDDYFVLKLRFNEIYTVQIIQSSPSVKTILETIDFSSPALKIFDLTAPIVNASLSKLNPSGTQHQIEVFVDDTVSTQRHVNMVSGIKSILVTSTFGGTLFDETYEIRTKPTITVKVNGITPENGDVKMEIVDHAGHKSTAYLAVWGDVRKDNLKYLVNDIQHLLDKKDLNTELTEKLENVKAEANEILTKNITPSDELFAKIGQIIEVVNTAKHTPIFKVKTIYADETVKGLDVAPSLNNAIDFYPQALYEMKFYYK